MNFDKNFKKCICGDWEWNVSMNKSTTKIHLFSGLSPEIAVGVNQTKQYVVLVRSDLFLPTLQILYPVQIQAPKEAYDCFCGLFP